jgi:hypothetical protein
MRTVVFDERSGFSRDEKPPSGKNRIMELIGEAVVCSPKRTVPRPIQKHNETKMRMIADLDFIARSIAP